MTIDTKNRSYNITAAMTLKRPSNTKYIRPSEDVVNWLHIQLKNRHTVFYKIPDPNDAEYDKEFEAVLSFIDNEIVNEIIPNKEYDLYRGPEKIGALKVIKK